MENYAVKVMKVHYVELVNLIILLDSIKHLMGNALNVR